MMGDAIVRRFPTKGRFSRPLPIDCCGGNPAADNMGSRPS
jgi:hypothetical protein